jgi:hypothetical protein
MVDDSEGDTPAGEYGNGYDISDAKADTQDTYSNIREAWHDARDTAAEEGGWGVPPDRHGSNDSGKCFFVLWCDWAI